MKLQLTDLEKLVESATYYRFPGTTVTVCCLTLSNGFSTIGYSACIDPAEFNAKMGEKLAREDATGKLWELEAYRVVCEGNAVAP